jgi:DNA replication protein DnaC
MTTNFPTPTDWKSAAWWRNRGPEERLFHSKIPRRFLECDFSEYNDISNAKLAAWVLDYKPGDNLFIQGKPGTGKSTMAQAVLKALVVDNPLSGRFVTADRYIEMLKDQFDNDNLLPEMYTQVRTSSSTSKESLTSWCLTEWGRNAKQISLFTKSVA